MTITILRTSSVRFFILGLVLFCARAGNAGETYEIDPVHSTVSFRIRHLGISSVTGSFTQFSGKGILDPQNPETSSIEVTIKATSINTASTKRDKHLRSSDFFDVEKFPTLSFKSTSVRKSGDGTYEMTGDFTMLGKTRSITTTVKDLGPADGLDGEKRHGGETAFKIKRSDWGMDKMLGPIGDEVQVTLAFSAIRK